MELSTILASLTGKKAEAIASPDKYPNLFENFDESLVAEKFYAATPRPTLASAYPEVEPISDRDLIDESIGFDVDESETAEVEPEVEPVAEPEPEVIQG